MITLGPFERLLAIGSSEVDLMSVNLTHLTYQQINMYTPNDGGASRNFGWLEDYGWFVFAIYSRLDSEVPTDFNPKTIAATNVIYVHAVPTYIKYYNYGEYASSGGWGVSGHAAYKTDGVAAATVGSGLLYIVHISGYDYGPYTSYYNKDGILLPGTNNGAPIGEFALNGGGTTTSVQVWLDDNVGVITDPGFYPVDNIALNPSPTALGGAPVPGVHPPGARKGEYTLEVIAVPGLTPEAEYTPPFKAPDIHFVERSDSVYNLVGESLFVPPEGLTGEIPLDTVNVRTLGQGICTAGESFLSGITPSLVDEISDRYLPYVDSAFNGTPYIYPNVNVSGLPAHTESGADLRMAALKDLLISALPVGVPITVTDINLANSEVFV